MLFPEVQRRYAESASLGRDFYDSQRTIHVPSLPRNERFLSEVQWEWFVKNMEPARKGMSQADSPRIAVTRTALVAVREVEMAGRRQIIGAVKHDQVLAELIEAPKDEAPPTRILDYKGNPVKPARDTTIVKGWARIATGRETCAWCLMLISRGAEFPGKSTQWYREASRAGISLDDETVIDLYNEAGGDLEKFRESTKDNIEEWHIGCDCLVVPVFDVQNWVGKDAARRAQQLWIEADKEARALIKSGEARSNNQNTETLNALRRRLSRGEISMSDYAFAA